MPYIIYFAAFALGFLVCWLIRRDPEVVAKHKEFETFKEYAGATEELINKIPMYHPLRLILLLDSIAVLSAYKRDSAMRLLTDTSIFGYNKTSKMYQGKFPGYDLDFMKLRGARRQVIIAIKNIYG